MEGVKVKGGGGKEGRDRKREEGKAGLGMGKARDIKISGEK